MRILHFALIVAFLMASTHMVVDHGGGPRDVVLIPHVSTLPFHAEDHDHEPSDSHAPSEYDADTHTHVEWYTAAAGLNVPYHPNTPVIIDRDAGLTAPLSVVPPHFWVKASPHHPSRVPLYFQIPPDLVVKFQAIDIVEIM